MSIDTQALTEQERLFFSRAAIHAASGLSLENACRAVLADDRRILEAWDGLNPYDRRYAAHRLAHQVFASVHTRLAAA